MAQRIQSTYVQVTSQGFKPSQIEIDITYGPQQIVWSWVDGTKSTIDEMNPHSCSPMKFGFTTGYAPLSYGQSFALTFKSPGTYYFADKLNCINGFVGLINVYGGGKGSQGSLSGSSFGGQGFGGVGAAGSFGNQAPSGFGQGKSAFKLDDAPNGSFAVSSFAPKGASSGKNAESGKFIADFGKKTAAKKLAALKADAKKSDDSDTSDDLSDDADFQEALKASKSKTDDSVSPKEESLAADPNTDADPTDNFNAESESDTPLDGEDSDSSTSTSAGLTADEQLFDSDLATTGPDSISDNIDSTFLDSNLTGLVGNGTEDNSLYALSGSPSFKNTKTWTFIGLIVASSILLS